MKQFKDCPLCGEKDAFISIEVPARTTPGSEGIGDPRNPTLGNYTFTEATSYYSMVHTGTCPKLAHVSNEGNRISLLKYHLGEMYSLHMSPCTFGDFQKAFKKQGFALREKVSDAVKSMYVGSKKNPRTRYLQSVADGKIDAFSVLVHRLLCGESFSARGEDWIVVEKQKKKQPPLRNFSPEGVMENLRQWKIVIVQKIPKSTSQP